MWGGELLAKGFGFRRERGLTLPCISQLAFFSAVSQRCFTTLQLTGNAFGTRDILEVLQILR